MWRDIDKRLESLKEIHEQYDQFVFFDTETTGLDFEKDKVIQLAAIKTDKSLNPIKTYNELCNPSPIIISKFIANLTGITNEDVAEARPEKEVLQDFLQDTAGCAYFAYNSPFDTGMIEGSMRSYGAEIKMPHFDVLEFARDVLISERNENFKLKTVSDYLGVTPENGAFHNAMFDIESTLAVFKELINRSWKAKLGMQSGSERPWLYTIRPWEKGSIKRLYITTSMGTLWYDKVRQAWGTKNAPMEKINMRYIEEEIEQAAKQLGFESIRCINENLSNR